MVEFKTADAYIDLCAKELVELFISCGGTVLIGVDDTASVLRLDPVWAGEVWVAYIARNKVTPAIDSKIEYAMVIVDANQNKKVLQVSVTKCKEQSSQISKIQYLVRIGFTSRLPPQELIRLFQAFGVFRFESTVVHGSSLSNINKNLFDQSLALHNINLADEPGELSLVA